MDKKSSLMGDMARKEKVPPWLADDRLELCDIEKFFREKVDLLNIASVQFPKSLGV
jgi:hypothetical protein